MTERLSGRGRGASNDENFDSFASRPLFDGNSLRKATGDEPFVP